MRKTGFVVVSMLLLQACSFSLSDYLPASAVPPVSETPATISATNETPTETPAPTHTYTATFQIIRNTPFVEASYPTQTPYLIPGVKTATPLPTITPALPWQGFESIKITQNKIYWGPCEADKPGSTKMTVKMQEPNKVHRVYLFLRLGRIDKRDYTSEWVGTVTDNDGGGYFVYTLRADNLPRKKIYPNAYVQYQFVAEDENKIVIGRSPVYLYNITLMLCKLP